MRHRAILWAATILLATLSSGCGSYKITFRVNEIINATPGDDNSRDRLDIDIVCLTKENAEMHPDIVNGQLRSDQWFQARQGEGSTQLGDFSKKQIHALRGKDLAMYSKYTQDTRAGDPLTPVADGGARKRIVKFHHPGWGSSEAAIVVYGRFTQGGRLYSSNPVVIKPVPSWNTEWIIEVDARKLTLRESE